MVDFRVIPQQELNKESFDYYPVWSEHYDYEEINDIERWGLNKEQVLKDFEDNSRGNDHCVYTLLETNPFPYRMRIFIKSKLFTCNGLELNGYIMNENSFCLTVFHNDKDFIFSRHELLSDLNEKTLISLAKNLNVDAKKIFPITYETDFLNKNGKIINGTFDFGKSPSKDKQGILSLLKSLFKINK